MNDFEKYKETLEKLKLDVYTYKSIYEMREKKMNIFDNVYRIIDSDKSFIVSKINSDEFSLFFNKPKKANYSNIGKSQELIFSTLQIEEFMKNNSIQDLEFQIDEEEDCNIIYYSKQKKYLDHIESE